MYERFTDRARKVMQLANGLAHYFNHECIATEHILLGLLQEGSGVAANVLRNLNVHSDSVLSEIEKLVPPGPYRFSRDRLPQTPRVRQVIAHAVEEAELLDSGDVGTAHLLLGLLRDEEGVASQVLRNLHVRFEDVRDETLRLLENKIPAEKSSDIPPLPEARQPNAKACSRIALEEAAMYERFTDRARKVMQLANQEAQRFNHEYMGTEHILLGLVKEGCGVAANVLKNLDIDLRKIRLEVEKIVQSGPDMVTMGKLPQTPRARKVIEYAIEECRNLHHNYVGTEHLLLGLLREEEGVASQVLMNLGLELAEVRKEVLQLLGYEVASEESHSGRVLVRRWSRGSRNQDGTPEKQYSGPPPEQTPPSADHERIRSLEKQLWNLRVLLGAVAGAVAGTLLSSDKGVVVVGLVLGGIFAGLGGRMLGALAGGITGLLLGCAHLSGEGGGLAGALLGALAGVLLAEIGGPPDRRGFLHSRPKR